MARVLRSLAWIMGVACVAIGVYHFIGGIDSVPGEDATGSTVDSRERFYAAIFLGYGLAWVWAARQSPVPTSAVRWLTGIFLLGGVGRLLSMLVYGQPHWFQLVLMVVELAVPALIFAVAGADERASEAACS